MDIKWSDLGSSDDVEAYNLQGDEVNHPEHYTLDGIETIDFIKSRLSHEEFKGYLRGNIIKYHSRANSKGREKDLKKAGVYQQWLNELLKEEDDA